MTGDSETTGSRAQGWRRGLLVILLAAAFAAWRGAGAAGEPNRAVHAVERPTETGLGDIAVHAGVDVRWVERGLVVFECAPGTVLPSVWRARQVAVRSEDLDLGLLWA